MSRVGQWLREATASLVRNPGYKSLSLGIAIVAWLYVQGGQVVEAKVRARVVWELPESLLAVEPLPASVTLTVAGPRNATRRAALTDVTIPIDLTQVSAGEVRLDFASFPVRDLPANVTVRQVDPASVRFVLDEVSAKKVRVEPRLVGDPAEGYLVASVAVSPQVVAIRGPRSVLEQVTEIATMPVDVSAFARDVESRVELDLPRTVVLVTDENLRVTVDIEPRAVRREFSEVPVEVWRAEGWHTEPETVRVVLEGPTVAVNGIEEQDIVVFAHLPDQPTRAAYSASWGPREGPRLRVLHGGGEEIKVAEVKPVRVRVVPQ